MVRKFAVIMSLGIAMLTGAAPASAADLGEQATNPIANLMSLRLQYQNSPSVYNADSSQQAGIFQAVVPFELSSKTFPMLVTRWTTPYVQTPDLGPGIGKKDGLGDTSGLAFLVKPVAPGHTIAFGTSMTIPTAGDNEFTGAGQWQLGPSAVYLNTKTPKLQWGLLAFQNWDVASSRSDAEDVSILSLQPILTKHFSGGWYVGAPDLPQTYDFEKNAWTLNLGAQVGRVFPLGKQPVQVFGAVYYNSEEDNELVSGEWTIKANISFLLPK